MGLKKGRIHGVYFNGHLMAYGRVVWGKSTCAWYDHFGCRCWNDYACVLVPDWFNQNRRCFTQTITQSKMDVNTSTYGPIRTCPVSVCCKQAGLFLSLAPCQYFCFVGTVPIQLSYSSYSVLGGAVPFPSA